MNCYPFIEAERAGRRNVARACALLKVSRAAFYSHLSGPCRREQQDAELTEQIKAVHAQSRGRYGAPRVHAELRRRGRRHSRKRVARLMRRAGIRGRAPRRWRKTTIADPAAAARADQVRRDFTADASKLNARWCGDITYLGTWEGWLYVATVIDIASRRVVGYALADHLRTELVADALANAVAARDPAPGVIFHSDRGCQYTSAAFADLASDYAVTLSHGRTGQCWDNALSESFFASLKGELTATRPWPTRAAASRAIVEYIGWYNGTRLHSTLGYRSPAEFEEDNKIKKVA
ncbi:MAG TPA: IS3 family transposase [Streptosporangiaceae bacterium]|nr:IS3 family transposase [Streptosporangiaceae bacterium]HEV2376625.1 IS3 family transposase [Streptosporangiaceae bacterium]